MFAHPKQSLVSRWFGSLARWGLGNVQVNRVLWPADFEPIGGELSLGSLAIEQESYDRAIATETLSRYRAYAFRHTKVLEYLASYALIPVGTKTMLDAAGGADSEFLRFVVEVDASSSRTHYAQDALVAAADSSGPIQTIGGSIESVPLSDGTLDFISCHHSFEHFQGDLDHRFLTEAWRLLRPGGRLAITPLFLANRYAEIWNTRKAKNSDPAAHLIYDPTATFCGWGPYERFARVYDAAAFRSRILSVIPEAAKIQLLSVRSQQGPEPDMSANKHQPSCNGDMRVFVVDKPLESREAKTANDRA